MDICFYLRLDITTSKFDKYSTILIELKVSSKEIDTDILGTLEKIYIWMTGEQYCEVAEFFSLRKKL